MNASQTPQMSTSRSSSKRRPKQKIEKSNEEFKDHERIIMDKRIAEINNVITKVQSTSHYFIAVTNM